MFLFGHVDFVFVFLNEPSFSFYETGNKSAKVFERGQRIFSESSRKTFQDLKSKSKSIWLRIFSEGSCKTFQDLKSKSKSIWLRIFSEGSRKTF